MRKKIFVLVALIFTFSIFTFAEDVSSSNAGLLPETSFGVDLTESEVSGAETTRAYGSDFSLIPTGQDFLLSLSASYMLCDSNYLSSITNLNFYLDPSFKYGWQIGIGKLFSVDLFLDWNLLGFIRGADFFIDWCGKCNTWLGDASVVINILLVGAPYLIGIFPALYYSCAGLDLGAFFFYHPYHNDWFDAKVGVGLSNEPGNCLDRYGYAWFFLPMISARAEANMIFGIFKLSFWANFAWDFFTTFFTASEKGGVFETDDGYNINFTRIQVGISLGFFVEHGSKASGKKVKDQKKQTKSTKIRGGNVKI